VLAWRINPDGAQPVLLEDDRSDRASFSFSAEQQVLRRLDKAFSAFFGRVTPRMGVYNTFELKNGPHANTYLSLSGLANYRVSEITRS
jgi:hypothetical protein